MLRLPILLLGCAVLSALPALCGPRPSNLRGPDRVRIHADYEAGDFDKVIRAAEGFFASGRACLRQDSVFLEKHLAVVYAADPKTRERGRYHMLRMLDMDPRADLLDMFVGEEVDGIFEKVRKESALKRTEAHMDLGPTRARGGLSQEGRGGKPAPSRAAASALPQRVSARTGLPKKAPAPTPKPKPFVPAPAPRLKSWNLDGEASAKPSLDWNPAPAFRTVPSKAVPAMHPAVSAMPASYHPVSAEADPAPAARPAPSPKAVPSDRPSEETAPKPKSPVLSRLKEPGFWAGTGAAVAVLGLTVYFAGGTDWTHGETRSKTYGVPSRPSP